MWSKAGFDRDVRQGGAPRLRGAAVARAEDGAGAPRREAAGPARTGQRLVKHWSKLEQPRWRVPKTALALNDVRRPARPELVKGWSNTGRNLVKQRSATWCITRRSLCKTGPKLVQNWSNRSARKPVGNHLAATSLSPTPEERCGACWPSACWALASIRRTDASRTRAGLTLVEYWSNTGQTWAQLCRRKDRGVIGTACRLDGSGDCRSTTGERRLPGLV